MALAVSLSDFHRRLVTTNTTEKYGPIVLYLVYIEIIIAPRLTHHTRLIVS